MKASVERPSKTPISIPFVATPDRSPSAASQLGRKRSVPLRVNFGVWTSEPDKPRPDVRRIDGEVAEQTDGGASRPIVADEAESCGGRRVRLAAPAFYTTDDNDPPLIRNQHGIRLRRMAGESMSKIVTNDCKTAE